MAKKIMKPGILSLRRSSNSQGASSSKDGTDIHSAPYLSARVPEMGPAAQAGIEEATRAN